uniref:Anaphase-promoting complex subunit 4 WD40 domain-containing protein n=1 Tax=Trichuris muris TaxID=70415 RepID=A0A5S6QBU0_TRIMR
MEAKAFLKRAVPSLITEIEQKRIIDDWLTRSESLWLERTCSCSLKCSLKPAEVKLNHISAITWNCSGSILAVSYGYKSHENWCFHESAIAAWSTINLTPKECKPDWYFPAVECYVDISFHPSSGKLLAAGLFNGIIQLYELSTSGGSRLVDQTTEEKAQPQLKSLHWLCVEANRTYLASCSANGITQLYLFTTERKLKLDRSFVITQERLPRVIRGSVHSNWPAGIVDLAILAGGTGDFVAAGPFRKSRPLCHPIVLFNYNLNPTGVQCTA